MILLKMSPKLDSSILEDICTEIIEHMKSTGAFDEIRVGLMEPIGTDSNFKNIIVEFEKECEHFCSEIDLLQPRISLRAKLATRFDENNHSESGYMLKNHIDRLLQSRNEEIKSTYLSHARAFLKNFLPKPDVPPEQIVDEIKEETKDGSEQKYETDSNSDMDVNSSEDGDIERPTWSPVSNHEHEATEDHIVPNVEVANVICKTEVETSTQPILETRVNSKHEESNKIIITYNVKIKEEEQKMTEPSLEDIPIPPDDDNMEDVSEEEVLNDDGLEEIERIPVLKSEIPQPPDDDSDELERLTFSSVSSIKTAELGDFDNSINLSDDEANFVGKPRNSKVPFEVIKNQLDDLAKPTTTTTIEPKQEQKESISNERNPTGDLVEASESDGGCSESTTTGKRVTRTRKSNPRYSNDLFKLL